MNFFGNHNFIEYKFEYGNRYICDFCLDVTENSCALYLKNQYLSKWYGLEKLNDLPDCDELMIKNILE